MEAEEPDPDPDPKSNLKNGGKYEGFEGINSYERQSEEGKEEEKKSENDF